MSKLNIDQQTIRQLFSDKKADFLIPDYQRPYAWGENECQTLWDDIFTFAFPDNDYSKFDSDSDEYFLGPIVTFKNENAKLEVIDGQQRLTTLMLLIRAFYSKFENMKDENSRSTREIIEKCIWKTDEFGKPNMNRLKIDSEVSTDDDKDEFINILKSGRVDSSMKSRYADTYRFFEIKIHDFLSDYPSYFAYLPTRILNNCILLPIEAESQDTALRIFSTLNDRGKPLADTDIFKAQLYKYYSTKGEKDNFISRWKALATEQSEDTINILKKTLNVEEKHAKKLPLWDLNLAICLSELNKLLCRKVIAKDVFEEFSGNKRKEEFAKMGVGIHEAGELCAFCGNELSRERLEKLRLYFSADEVEGFRKDIQEFIDGIDEVLKKLRIFDVEVTSFYPDKIGEANVFCASNCKLYC